MRKTLKITKEHKVLIEIMIKKYFPKGRTFFSDYSRNISIYTTDPFSDLITTDMEFVTTWLLEAVLTDGKVIFSRALMQNRERFFRNYSMYFLEVNYKHYKLKHTDNYIHPVDYLYNIFKRNQNDRQKKEEA